MATIVRRSTGPSVLTVLTGLVCELGSQHSNERACGLWSGMCNNVYGQAENSSHHEKVVQDEINGQITWQCMGVIIFFGPLEEIKEATNAIFVSSSRFSHFRRGRGQSDGGHGIRQGIRREGDVFQLFFGRITTTHVAFQRGFEHLGIAHDPTTFDSPLFLLTLEALDDLDWRQRPHQNRISGMQFI